MKTTLTLTMAFMLAMTATSCKKNWECTVVNPAGTINTHAIIAKKKREAKLECQANAADDDTWELKAR